MFDDLEELAAAKPLAVALLAMQDIRNRVHTSPEERTADECIEAVRTAFGVKE